PISTLPTEPNDVWAALSALHSKRAAGRSVRGNNREGVHNFRDLQAYSQQESDPSLRQEVTLGNRAVRSREVVEGSEESGESGKPHSGQNSTGDEFGLQTRATLWAYPSR